ncbi:MAG TPA: LysM peptidoglycan-binding domain-containing protein [Candidatus Saccharimonadia bacterium]|nr:LysM peptidoglycan-binding domain-containing protein [Candidatus Saccharimonadia bacterium]
MRTLVPKSEGSVALVTAMLGGLLLMMCSGTPALAAAATTPSSKAKSQTLAPAYVEHKVTRGETLWRIAQKHKTSVGSIMDYNRMSDQIVREGMTLRIPTPRPQDAKTQREHLHVVKSSETFWSIADDYGISPKALAQANPNVNPNRLHEDMELVIPVEERAGSTTPGTSSGNGPAPAPTQPGMMAHKVDDNETYYSIAKRYGITMDAMVAANPQVKPERLRPGMTVQVPMKTTRPPANPSPRPAPAPENSGGSTVASGPTPRTYKIRSGDTMASIAQKHGVSEAALLKENKLSASDPFYVDDVLKVPAGQSASGNKTVVQPGEKPGTSPQPPKQQTKDKSGSVPAYIVSAGEDIGTICDAFGISRQQLLEYNRLPANARLKTGDQIMIPKR